MKPAGDVTDAKLFGDWFDLIEADLCTKVCRFIETMIEQAFDREAQVHGGGCDVDRGDLAKRLIDHAPDNTL